MKKNSVITINGVSFNPATGERIVEEIREKKDFGGFFEEIAKESHEKRGHSKISKKTPQKNDIKSQNISEKPRKKRISKAEKQAEIAKKIQSEIAELDGTKSRKSASVRQASASSPKWIANFAKGNPPLEITPDETRSFKKAEMKTVSEPKKIVRREAASATKIHPHRAQKSSTLNRRFVKAPQPQAISRRRKERVSVATHPMVSHFAKTEKPAAVPHESEFKIPVSQIKREFSSSYNSTRIRETEAGAPKARNYSRKSEIAKDYDKFFSVSNAIAKEDFAKFSEEKSRKSAARNKQKSVSESQLLKNALIREQMESPVLMKKLNSRDRRKAEKLQRRISGNSSVSQRKHFRASTVATVMVAAILAGGYLAYVNMPGISLRIAAAQAGVDARTALIPNGYSQSSSVAYQPGQITVNYKSNGGDNSYSLTQSKTSMNSNAVRESLVPRNAKNLSDGVYKYGDRAVWLSGDTLFTLDGNQYLSDQQITEIAKSVKS